MTWAVWERDFCLRAENWPCKNIQASTLGTVRVGAVSGPT